MIHTYRVSIIQQLLLLFHLVLVYTVLFSVYYYFFNTIIPYGFYIYVFLFLFLCDILSTLTLHLQYYIRNKGAVLTINSEQQIISYGKNNYSESFSFSDIESIERVSSYAFGSYWYSFDEYRYYQVYLKNKIRLIITCMMINNIEENFERRLQIRPQKRLRIYAFLPDFFSRSSVTTSLNKKN